MMHPRVQHSFNRLAIIFVLMTFLVTLVACGSSGSGGTTNTPTPAATAPVVTTVPATLIPTPAVTGYPIKVYFSKFPDSGSNFTAVFPVDRVSPTQKVEVFAIQFLIAGPTPEERSNGYFSELNSILTGPSNCSAPYPTGGPDFTLTLNRKGSAPEQGTATLQFCRSTMSPGIGADARILAEIKATLTQFPTIKKVVVLDKNGHCFADESGQDLCLK